MTTAAASTQKIRPVKTPWVTWDAATRDERRSQVVRRVSLVPSTGARLLVGAIALGWLVLPLLLEGFALKLYVQIGIAAIGAIGLNLLSGSAGQVSLGHPFFIGTGAYCAAVFGGDWGLSLPVWLLGCALVGGIIGAAVGPFALRLRGNYLVIVTIALVFVGSHIFNNWTAVTGGVGGRAVTPTLALLGFDFGDASIPTAKDQRFAYVVWAITLGVAFAVANILRSRPGRALQAIRDRDMTAEVLGVHLAHYKISAFALSSATAAVAGGLYGAYVGFVSPAEWNLMLSIQYLAMIIVGGMGSVAGSVVGAAVIVALPHGTQALLELVPFTGGLVSRTAGDGGAISVFALNQIIFGALMVFFLAAAPRGLVSLPRLLASR